jgi:hypothetical protein
MRSRLGRSSHAGQQQRLRQRLSDQTSLPRTERSSDSQLRRSCGSASHQESHDVRTSENEEQSSRTERDQQPNHVSSVPPQFHHRVDASRKISVSGRSILAGLRWRFRLANSSLETKNGVNDGDHAIPFRLFSRQLPAAVSLPVWPRTARVYNTIRSSIPCRISALPDSLLGMPMEYGPTLFGCQM